MDYFYCNKCGAIFNEETARYEVSVERHWWLDDCPTQVLTEMLCPECCSYDVSECEYCDICGEPCKPEELTDGLCKSCYADECAKDLIVNGGKD